MKRYRLPFENLPVNTRLAVLRNVLPLFHRSGRAGKVLPCPGHPLPAGSWCNTCESLDGWTKSAGTTLTLNADKQEGTYSINMYFNAINEWAEVPVSGTVGMPPFILGFWMKHQSPSGTYGVGCYAELRYNGAYIVRTRPAVWTPATVIVDADFKRAGCVATRSTGTIKWTVGNYQEWIWYQILAVTDNGWNRYRCDSVSAGGQPYWSFSVDPVCNQTPTSIRFIAWPRAGHIRVDYLRLVPLSYGLEYPPA